MALAKGKKSHDKRESTKEKEIKRAMARVTKR
jgi:tmRNA-binding protein